MNIEEQLDDREKWNEDDGFNQYNEFTIEHTELPLEIIVEETGSHAENDENWETWLHVKEESFESEIPYNFNKTFEYRDEAQQYARELAYNSLISQYISGG